VELTINESGDVLLVAEQPLADELKLHEPNRYRSDYVRLDANRLIAATPTAGVHHVIVLDGPATSLTHYGRQQILIRISELLVDILQLDPSLTWVYINPLANTDMVEFGHTLRLPGAEQQWIEQMPTGLREHLLELNKHATR
jgi:hypothetical protein